MDLRDALHQYHSAADEFSKGNADPVKVMFSRGDDVILANPFGPAVCGWKQVEEALDFASSRFRDGEVTSVETIAEYAGPGLATVFEIERWRARVGERDDITPFVLRVTTTFRLERGAWKIVHRHADPIATPHSSGPLRSLES